MTKPPRPFTSERPVGGITGSGETVTNNDILDAFHDLLAHFPEAKMPRRFTSESRSLIRTGVVATTGIPYNSATLPSCSVYSR